MVAESILVRLQAEFDSAPEAIRSAAELFAAGASPEYVSMFQRDVADLGEERLTAIHERLQFLLELDTRRHSVLENARQQGRADVGALESLIESSVDRDLLDDVDHLLRPHSHKAEARVADLGLGELVEAVHEHRLGDETPQAAAARFLDPARGLGTPDLVLAQVVMALAERYGEDPWSRRDVRNELSRGILRARAAQPGGGAPPAPAGSSPTASRAPRAEIVEEFGAGDLGLPTTESAVEATGEPEVDVAAMDSALADVPFETDVPVEFDVAQDQSTDSQSEELELTDAALTDAALTDAALTDAATPDAATPDAATPDAATPDAATAEPDASEAVAVGESTEDPATEPRRQRPTTGERRAKRAQRKSKARYEDFFGLEEPVRRIPSQRMLALRHAEREGILALRLDLPPNRELELFRERFSKDVASDTPLGQFLDLVYGHAYDTHVHRPCEQIVRHNLKDKADRETVRAFARSLRSQLMAPALTDHACAALRVAGRTVWFVTLATDGAPRHRLTLPLPSEPGPRAELIKTLCETIASDEPFALAIPHGRRESAAGDLAQEVLNAIEDPARRPQVVPVDETASVVWATSATARRRHSSSDTGLRVTLSLARRLRDPLFELMRVEPRGLGLGQNLTEVHQGLLKRQLDATASSCLAHIGIDAQRADVSLLGHAPGVSAALARAIVQARTTAGGFKTLADLRSVEGMDDDRFRFVVGFLRLRDGDEPLDATAVHPDDYEIARAVARQQGVEIAEILGRSIPRLGPAEVGVDVTERHLAQVVSALRLGTADPRGHVQDFRNDGVARFEDLTVDRQLRGRITNLAEFGAFVDIGVGHDGLVHVSQIPGSRLRDPERVLRVGEVVQVYVVHLDPKAKKISLTMLKPRHLAEGRPPTIGERMRGGGGGGGSGAGAGAGAGAGGRRRRNDDVPVMNRAARAPEGRRGAVRRGPRPPTPKAGEPGRDDSDDRSRGPRRGRDRDRGGEPSGGKPRVIIVESEIAHEQRRGHKGELRSLSGLRALLPSGPDQAGQDAAGPKAADRDGASRNELRTDGPTPGAGSVDKPDVEQSTTASIERSSDAGAE